MSEQAFGYAGEVAFQQGEASNTEDIEHAQPLLALVPELVPEPPPVKEPEQGYSPTATAKHRAEHGQCYRDECVARFGAPLVTRLALPFTPHG